MRKMLVADEICTVCGGGEHQIIFETIRDGEGRVAQCSSCGFVFLENATALNYESDYPSLTLDSEWDLERSVNERQRSLKRFLGEMESHILETGAKTVLELGAGIGAVMRYIESIEQIEKTDCVEPNKNLQDVIRNTTNRNNVIYDSLSEIKEKYDFIYAIHVFEHFIDPVGELKNIERICNEGGVLYLVFPNYDDFYQEHLPEEKKFLYNKFMYHRAHPYYYSTKTFLKLIKLTNWSVLDIHTIQEYSIVNFFKWYHSGVPSKNIIEATQTDEIIAEINKVFLERCEKYDNGSSVVVKLTRVTGE